MSTTPDTTRSMVDQSLKQAAKDWDQFGPYPDTKRTLRPLPELEANLAEIQQRLVQRSRMEIASAAPRILQAMIARAEGDGRDAQRAGERLLEVAGVLPKQGAIPTEGLERIDLIAARMSYRSKAETVTMQLAPAAEDDHQEDATA